MLAAIMMFLLLAAVVAAAGVVLATAADAIAEGTGLGRLLVGSILLAAATSLPELSVDLAAVRQGLPDLAVGDLLGSSLMNLLILASLDLVVRSRGGMLSREAASHALSGTLSIALTALVAAGILAGDRLPAVGFAGIGGWAWAVLVAYLLGARMVFLDQRISLRMATEAALDEGGREGGGGRAASPDRPGKRLVVPVVAFALATVVLLLAGPRLATTAEDLATRTGIGRTFVGTTLVAVTTSLPELVASITAIRLNAFAMVVGNVFGSNAFNMVLVVPLDAAGPGRLLAEVSPVHAVTALAAIVATSIAVLGQLYHVERRIRLVEPDAALVLLVVFGALGLVYRLG
jgi:cation:H+ antiporter